MRYGISLMHMAESTTDDCRAGAKMSFRKRVLELFVKPVTLELGTRSGLPTIMRNAEYGAARRNRLATFVLVANANNPCGAASRAYRTDSRLRIRCYR